MASVPVSEFVDYGVEQVGGGGAGRGELRFQCVHQGHQLVHLGHDPALFGEGWDGRLESFHQFAFLIHRGALRKRDTSRGRAMM